MHSLGTFRVAQLSSPQMVEFCLNADENDLDRDRDRDRDNERNMDFDMGELISFGDSRYFRLDCDRDRDRDRGRILFIFIIRKYKFSANEGVNKYL
jgi:hypothetical protein